MSVIYDKALELTVLRRARARVAQGWCQFDYGIFAKPDDPVCATGALIWAGASGVYDVEHFHPLLGFDPGNSELPVHERRLTIWNDMPGRTQAEVVARFDAAIERLSSHG